MAMKSFETSSRAVNFYFAWLPPFSKWICSGSVGLTAQADGWLLVLPGCVPKSTRLCRQGKPLMLPKPSFSKGWSHLLPHGKSMISVNAFQSVTVIGLKKKKRQHLARLMKVSMLENFTVTEHKSNSLFDILIANKEKKNHSLENWTKLTCVNQTLQRSLSSPVLCPAAAPNIMQTMAAVAITGHTFSL